VVALLQELVHFGIYKRSQGRITRQLTFAALAVIITMGLWRLSETLTAWDPPMRYGVPGLLLLVGLWICYRVVNVPRVADFLIAVEAEMNKVSWPSRGELFRASLVVLVTIFVLATVLFGYDYFWHLIFVRVLKVF
jgi:preprotein translocase subunit SecE